MWHGYRHIGITSSTLGQLDRMLLNNYLPLAKIRVNRTLVLLCCCGPRTILKKDNRRLEAFHVRCQCRILGIKRSNFIIYDYASSRLTTGLRDICDTIVYRRHILSDTLGTSRRTCPRRPPSNYASMPIQKRSQVLTEGVHTIACAITGWNSWDMITDSMLCSCGIYTSKGRIRWFDDSAPNQENDGNGVDDDNNVCQSFENNKNISSSSFNCSRPQQYSVQISITHSRIH